jgi:hypothetical protein
MVSDDGAIAVQHSIVMVWRLLHSGVEPHHYASEAMNMEPIWY